MTKDDLLIKIEQYRKKMVELSLTTSFIDEQVVQISGQLDKLLNKYHKINKY